MIKSIYRTFTENIIRNDETLTKLSLNQKQEDHLYHSHLPARCRAEPVEEDKGDQSHLYSQTICLPTRME